MTAWLALTPSHADNGAMGFIPGTQKKEQIPHRDTFAKNNLLTRGQEIAVDVDGRAVTVALEPGEISLHHVRVVHGSPANPSDDRRIGFAIRYIPTSVAQVGGEDSATLVRGVDRFGHFAHEPRPERDMDPAFVRLHREVTERNAKILYSGTAVKSYNDPEALPDRAATDRAARSLRPRRQGPALSRHASRPRGCSSSPTRGTRPARASSRRPASAPSAPAARASRSATVCPTTSASRAT